MRVCVYMCRSEDSLWESVLLPPCGFPQSCSGCQTWLQPPLPASYLNGPTSRSSCFCISSVGITGLHHLAWPNWIIYHDRIASPVSVILPALCSDSLNLGGFWIPCVVVSVTLPVSCRFLLGSFLIAFVVISFRAVCR